MYEQELDCAMQACAAAGRIQLDGRASVLDIQIKGDDSPVTQIDRACEERIVAMVGARFPRDGFLGEETGGHPGSSGRVWIIDPLDGTRPYIRGIPTYSVLLALQDGDAIVAGVIHLPEMGLTCHARLGNGAFCNSTRLRVSDTATLPDAMSSCLGFRERRATPEGNTLLNFMCDCGYSYGFMDAYTYYCVAAGKIDVAVNLLDKPWDCASAACIVTEAGGTFSDIHGNPNVHNGSAVLSNRVLHSRVLEYFTGT